MGNMTLIENTLYRCKYTKVYQVSKYKQVYIKEGENNARLM